MERVFTPGRIIENSKESGEQTKCRAKVHSRGPMEESMLASTLKTKRKDMANSSGQMVGVTEESGLTESNMAKEPMFQVKAKRSTASGGMERESDG